MLLLLGFHVLIKIGRKTVQMTSIGVSPRTTPRKPSDEEARKSRRYSIGSVQPMAAGRATVKNRNKMLPGHTETQEAAGSVE